MGFFDQLVNAANEYAINMAKQQMQQPQAQEQPQQQAPQTSGGGLFSRLLDAASALSQREGNGQNASEQPQQLSPLPAASYVQEPVGDWASGKNDDKKMSERVETGEADKNKGKGSRKSALTEATVAPDQGNVDVNIDDFLSRPLGESVMRGMADSGGYGWAYTMNPNWTNPEHGQPDKGTKDTKTGKPSTTSTDSDDSETKAFNPYADRDMYGMSTADWNALEQADQYYKWLETEEGQKFLDKYGDRLNEENMGYTNLRLGRDMEGYDPANEEALADLLGFGDMEGIKTWRSLYTPYGVDWNSEDALQDFYDLYYGPEAANIEDWFDNTLQDYDYSKMGQKGSAYNEASKWVAENYPELIRSYNSTLYGMDENGNAKSDNFDIDDFIQLAAMVRGSQTGNLDWIDEEDLNTIFGNAGEGYKIGQIDGEDGMFKKKDNPEFKNKMYTFDPSTLNKWGDVLADQNFLDTALYLLNRNSAKTGKTYGINS